MDPSNDPFLVVGLGASAGGLGALETFFAGLPKTDGAAFVVVIHLAPDRESELAEILARSVPLPFTQVTGRTEVERGHVYVIPPDRNLVMADGHLDVEPLPDARHQRRPVDHFFRTLADAWGERSVAVVLSGTGQNGTVGAGRVKEVGGLVLAQDPADAEFDEMPRSALASGVVDHTAPADGLGREVIDYADRLHRVRLAGDGDPGDDVEAVRHILSLLRTRTGHDFSHYKRATILRRLERRLHVVGADTLSAYLGHLREHPAEAQRLLDDLLIHVTNFFRDPPSFGVLERDVLPGLFEQSRGEVRVWVAGCATGEEAYTVAMLLAERASEADGPVRFQVFATDLSEDAIQTARAGVYPGSIEADVSPERLRRFFRKVPGGYQVTEGLRERVLFAPHSLLKDPPFARLDLVTCRNLLIYLQRGLQRRVLELFHYALVPGGRLFLGASETADAATELFTPVDKPARVYVRREAPSALPHVPSVDRLRRPEPVDGEPVEPDEPASVAALHERERAAAAPPSVLVDATYNVVHLSDGVGPYLQMPSGDPTQSVVRLVVPELRPAVQTALFQTRRQTGPVETGPVRLGGDRAVRLRVASVEATGLVQVTFLDVPPPPAVPSEDSGEVQVLADELQETREQLQVTIEEFETSREELRAQNEELQSMNEELRSTAEELETSKEEAQSMAEELQTVNDELKAKVDELAQASGDLENLIASTEIATLFLDRRLRIQWFTPHVRQHFHVRSSDVGRPLADLAQKFGGGVLVEDAEAVLDRLAVAEREVENRDGRWYLVQVRPYRVASGQIEGVVVTFVDITQRRHQGADLARRAQEFQALIEASAQTVWTTDADGQVTVDSPSWRAYTGQTTAEWLGEGWGDAVHPDDRAGALAAWRAAVRTGEPYENVFRLRRADGEWRWTRVRAVPLPDGDGGVRGWIGTNEDVTERRRAQRALEASEARYRTLFESISEGFAIAEPVTDGDGAVVDVRWVEANPAFEVQSGLRDAVGRTALELVPDLEPEWIGLFATVALQGERVAYERRVPSMGRWFETEMIPVGDGPPYRIATLFTDVSERHLSQAALRASAERAAFRAELAEVLRPLDDPEEVQVEACRVIGEHLGASRVHYAEVEADGEHATVARDYPLRAPDRSGRYALADFPALAQSTRGGETFVVTDVEADPRLDGAERGVYGGLPVRALVAVPLVKGGRLEAVFAVHSGEPRDWTDDEVALAEQTAERTWAAVEAARAEAALRETEARFRQAVDAARMGVWSYDVATGRTTLDAQGQALFGVDEPEHDGAALVAHVHPDDRAAFEAARDAALDPDGPGTFAATHRVVRPAGDVRWVRGQAEVAFEAASGGRRAVRASGVVFDVTDQVEAQEALRESEERFREVASTVPDVLFTAGPDGLVTYVSAQFRTFTGAEPDEVVGTPMWPHLICPDDLPRVEAAWARATGGGERFEEHYRLRSATGGHLWVIARARPVLDDEGGLARWFGTVTDVDALTRAEQALQSLNETLEARVAERTAQARRLAAQLSVAEQDERQRLAHVLHDDLQQQLYGLSLLLAVARSSVSGPADDQLARAEVVLADATALTRSLSSDLNPVVLESERVEDLARWLAEREAERDVLAVEVEGSGVVEDASVRALLYQALRELLFNVVKHSGTDRARITVSMDGDTVAVGVADSGAGFDPSGSEFAEGFGLASVRNRLSLVGGRVEVASAPGEGTRVTVVVPSGSV